MRVSWEVGEIWVKVEKTWYLYIFNLNRELEELTEFKSEKPYVARAIEIRIDQIKFEIDYLKKPYLQD